MLENAINVYGYFKFAKTKGHFYLKWLCYLNCNEFLRKMKLRYLTGTEAEVKNLIRIYLQPAFDEQNNNKGGVFLHGVENLKNMFLQEGI